MVTAEACAFFNSPEDEYDTLLPFVREGLDRGERAYHVPRVRNLRTHPVTIIGGPLYANPFFVPPQELVGRFLERDAPKPYRA